MSCNTRIAGTATLGAALLIGSGLSASPAQAAYVVTLTQEGPNVVASGSGTINTTDLNFYYSQPGPTALVAPYLAAIWTGQFPTEIEYFKGAHAGPPSFGSGGTTFASSGSGSVVAILNYPDLLVVPYDYVSGSPLIDTSTYDNATFSSLGVTPGIYVWTWGSGANADSFTLEAEAAAVPEPATLGLMVIGLLGAGFSGPKRRQARPAGAAAAGRRPPQHHGDALRQDLDRAVEDQS